MSFFENPTEGSLSSSAFSNRMPVGRESIWVNSTPHPHCLLFGVWTKNAGDGGSCRDTSAQLARAAQALS